MRRTVFDIGAHKGEDSKYYLERGYKVIAFECSPSNIEYLKKRFHEEIKTKNMILETRALLLGGGNHKKVNFYVDNVSVWGTLNKDWAKRNSRLGSQSKSILVETLDPSEIYRIYGNPYFIKIDIEGSDMDVLRSLFNVKFEKRPKYLSIESSKTSWIDLMEEFQVLKKLGYTNFQAIPQSRMGKKLTKWKSLLGEKVSFRHDKNSSGPFGEDLSNNWVDFIAIKKRYKFVFLKYKLFGDDGIFAPRKIKFRILRAIYSRILFETRLGADWFDTHAKKNEKI